MRIIAGKARGRRFDAPAGMDTRPTLDRVKEAMFGMLQFEISDSSVLDLFSGSGNLGLEAASRGAKLVICNDRSKLCADQIRKNADALHLAENVMVMQLDYPTCIQRLTEQNRTFDLVFLDAPYQDGTAQKAAELLIRYKRLNPNGKIILEHAVEIPPILDDRIALAITSRHYGTCAFTVFKEVQAQ